MRIAIHQPYFLPWLGFFSKIMHADGYVALDDVQFRKRHYHDRAKIVSMTGELIWVGIPVGDHLKRLMNEIIVSDANWTRKIIRTIEYSYAKGSEFPSEWPGIRECIMHMTAGMSLSDINIRIIEYLLTQLRPGQGAIIWKSSMLGCTGDATDRIIQICRAVGASEIIVGAGASLSNSVHDLRRMRTCGIRMFKQDFRSANVSYVQVRRQRLRFAAGASAIDAILNVGSLKTASLLSACSLVPTEVELT